MELCSVVQSAQNGVKLTFLRFCIFSHFFVVAEGAVLVGRGYRGDGDDGGGGDGDDGVGGDGGDGVNGDGGEAVVMSLFNNTLCIDCLHGGEVSNNT